MRDLIAGKRKMIKTQDCQIINVPFFEGLSIAEMLEWAQNRPEGIMEALPIVQREIQKLPRSYVCNVIHTLAGDAFVKWVEKQVNERNSRVAKEASLIEMDSQIAAIYQASTAVSVKYPAWKQVICPLILALML